MKKFLLATAAAVLGLSLAACGAKKLGPDQQKAAEYSALQFTNTLRGQFVSCTNVDEKKSGFVTCTSRIPTPTIAGGHRLEVTELACPYDPKVSGGCKLATPRR